MPASLKGPQEILGNSTALLPLSSKGISAAQEKSKKLQVSSDDCSVELMKAASIIRECRSLQVNSLSVVVESANRSVSVRTVYERRGTPLLVQLEYALRIPSELPERCERELFARREATQVTGFSSTFLLGVEEREERFPESTALVRFLHEQLIALNENIYGHPFEFSFLKIAHGKPPAMDEGVYYPGFHLDSHPALSESRELLRVLVNVSTQPREFAYCETDWRDLVGYGIPVGRTGSVPLVVPSTISRKTVLLPGLTATSVSALRFWASVLPHVGINSEDGSFLASFESIADVKEVNIA